MLGMEVKAQVLFLSVNQWNIEKENKAGFTVWMCMSESKSSNKKGFEPVKQSLEISNASIVAPLLASDTKLPCIAECSFDIVAGGQSAKTVLKSVNKVIKSIDLV